MVFTQSTTTVRSRLAHIEAYTDLELTVGKRMLRDFAVLVAGFLLLVGPLWLLMALTATTTKLTVITTLIAGFMALVYGLDVGRPVEVIGAAAA